LTDQTNIFKNSGGTILVKYIYIDGEKGVFFEPEFFWSEWSV
jgi:hypothetical protein